MIKQEAPWPEELEELISGFKYKPGWRFELKRDLDRGQGSVGATLDCISRTYNSYHPENGEGYYVHHYIIVPPAAFNRRSWRYWLLQRLIEIETHEACEFFQDGDERPFAPNHGPGNDPYMIVTLGTQEETKTSFRGDINS